MNDILSYEGPRQPDMVDAAGKAWEWKTANPAAVGVWLLHRPDAHPFWHNYLIGVAHLREEEGIAPPVKARPEATHEIIILALDPKTAPDPDRYDSICPLHPPNLAWQIDRHSDASARLLCEKLVKAMVTGALSPDTDHTSCQERWLRDQAEDARQTN